MRTIISKIILFATLLMVAMGAVIAAPETDRSLGQIEKSIRKELVTLPFYDVFDNLAFKVEGSTMTLYGQVTRPTTRKDAENRVKRIKGIERVVNNIEVLPLSRFDDDIRIRTYYAVFGRSGLYRYAMGANPSVHIIVNHGHVTLEGVVANKMDRQLAEIAARSVPGVFSVTNNLRTERGGEAISE